MYFPATLSPHGDGRYDVTFVDLPGCVSQGASLEDALDKAEEALSLHIAGMQEDKLAIPQPSTLEQARVLEETESRENGEDLDLGTIFQLVRVVPVKIRANVQVTVSMKDDFLRQVDEIREDLGMTRSGIVVASLRQFIKSVNV